MPIAFLSRALTFVRRCWFEIALCLIFAVVSVQYSVKVLEKNGSAFIRWRAQILQLDVGEDIYQRFTYPNPPIMALMLRPLADMPPLAGSLCWFYLKVAMTLLAIHWVLRLVQTAGMPFPPWGKAVAVLLAIRPIIGDLTHGNVNLLILFLVVAALYALHKKRPWLAGGVLALAIACKVTPVLFLPYLVWKRQWKALGGCAVGLVLFFWLTPSLILGWQQNQQLLTSWADQMLKPYLVEGKVFYSEHNNQSLPGLVQRLTTHSPSVSDYIDDQYTPLAYHNLVDWDPAAARWLVRGGMILFAALVLWSCRTPTAAPGQEGVGWRLVAEYSLILLGMLLLSERTWKHHCVTLLLPLTVIVYYLTACRPQGKMRLYLIGTLAAAMLLMACTVSGLPILDAISLHALAYGAYVWAFVLLAAALAVMLRFSRAPGPDLGRTPARDRSASAKGSIVISTR